MNRRECMMKWASWQWRTGAKVVAFVLVCLLAAFPRTALAAVTSNVAAGVLTINSDADPDTITVTCVGGQVKINGNDPGTGAANCNTLAEIIVNGDAGDDTIDLSGVTAVDFTALLTVTVTGGDNGDTLIGSAIADTLLGSQGNDQLTGGDGNDTLIGGPGSDTKDGGLGDDLLIWNNGDGTDVMNGDDGNDLVQVNGSPANPDFFEIAPLGARVAFTRTNLGPFSLDISAEDLEINGLGGDDIMTGTVGLSGLITMTMNGNEGSDQLTGGDGDDTLVGGPGNDTKNGGPGNDLLIWNNGDGTDIMNGDGEDDLVRVNGSDQAGDFFEVAPLGGRVAFTRTNLGPFSLDISAERLQIHGRDGDDIMTGTVGLTGLITMTMNGGDGNDRLTGGDGPDTLDGNDGDDTLIGFRGNDTMDGGLGNDLLIWNNGDGTDVMDGDDGNDQVQVNGAPAANDFFEIAPLSGRVAFTRTNLGVFGLNIRAENLEVNGLGGDDIMTGTVGLSGLITMTLNGNDGNDRLTGGDGIDTLNGGLGDDTLTGFRGNDIMNGGPGVDRMIWNNGDGTDIMNGDDDSDTAEVNGSPAAGDFFEIAPAGARVAFSRTNLGLFSLDISAESLLLNGLGGDDIMTGTVGLTGLITMTMNGGDGNDHLTGGDGNDTLNGDPGDDTLIGFRGNDTMNGGPGNDRMIWNNGDGTDVMNGDDGNDTAEVNGAPAAGDAFTILPVAGRVAFSRTNLGLFSLDISAENLEVNSLGGDDVVSATPLPNTEVRLDGGDPASSDTLTVDLQNQIIFLWPGRLRTEDSQRIFYVNFEVVNFVDAIFRLLIPLIEGENNP